MIHRLRHQPDFLNYFSKTISEHYPSHILILRRDALNTTLLRKIHTYDPTRYRKNVHRQNRGTRRLDGFQGGHFLNNCRCPASTVLECPGCCIRNCTAHPLSLPPLEVVRMRGSSCQVNYPSDATLLCYIS